MIILVLETLRCMGMGKWPCFSTIITKGNNFLFAFLDEKKNKKLSNMGSIFKEKNLLQREQIL